MKPPSNAPAYAFLIPMLASMAQEHGYALAVHGSLTRDLDLVAIPWTDAAISAEELVEVFLRRLGGSYLRVSPEQQNNPQLKPHGRRAWTIGLNGTPYLDLSIMPRVVPEPPLRRAASGEHVPECM